MAAVDLTGTCGAETLMWKKGAPVALLSAPYTGLLTTFTQIGNADGYYIGNAPIFAGVIDWTDGSGVTGTLAILVSPDGVKYTKLPIFATPSSGVSAVSPGKLTYAVSAWDNALLPVGTVGTAGTDSLPFEFRLGAYRYVKLFILVDDATGASLAVTSQVWVGGLA